MATIDRDEEQSTDPAPRGEASAPEGPEAQHTPASPPLADTALPGDNGHESAPPAPERPAPRAVRRVLLTHPPVSRPAPADVALDPPPNGAETRDAPVALGPLEEASFAADEAQVLPGPAAPQADGTQEAAAGAATLAAEPAPNGTPETGIAPVSGAAPDDGAIVGEEAPHAFGNGAAPRATAPAVPLPGEAPLDGAPDPDLLEVLPLHPPAPTAPDESPGHRRYRQALADAAIPATRVLPAEGEKKPGLLEALNQFWLWRSRGFWLGAPAVAYAMFGQRLIATQQAILVSIRWYALAIFLMIVSWLGTYKNKTFLSAPVERRAAVSTLPVRVKAPALPAPGARRFGRLRLPTLPRGPRMRVFRRVLGGERWRWGLALLAFLLNLYCANQLRSDYYSAVGGYGWAVSLILLLLAFVGERPVPHRSLDAGAEDVEDRTDVRLPWRIETVLFLGLVALTFAMRFYRLDDWTTGMHGDEGEAGMDAINIIEGRPVSPFLTGWFSQPNFYYWGIAIFMKVFNDTGMGGVRLFSAFTGALMVIPLYFLVRHWFGVRAALLAGTFLAISDVAIHFSRQEFSNITTPFFLVIGFLFLFRGLRNMRTLEFVLSGYAFMLSMYFYLGGRLTPFMLIGVAAYFFVLLPIVRLPGVYGALREQLHGLGRWTAFKRAVMTQVRGVIHYLRPVLVFTIACIAFASPWLVYFLDHQFEWNARSQDKLIFNNVPRMQAQYPWATNEPLYIGLRQPRPDDVWPFSPVVFEQLPNSIKLSDNGFWARVIWGQLTTTLSIFTYRFDASSVYTFTQEPVAKPIEAALIILGIAWALWRWRDSRMAMLSMWFWSTVIVGGVLTIDAPYMARLVGVIPVTAIFAALPLNKLSAEFVNLLGQFGRRVTMARVGQAVSATVLVAILAWLFGQNTFDYYTRYTANWPFTEVTGQAYFVREMNRQVMSEGRPAPKYYNLGMHMIYWGHGNNRFLNHGTDGIDMVNPSNELPVLDNGDRDIVFMVWDLNKHYLQVIKDYYPGGEEKPFFYSANQDRNFLFTAYRVKREQIDQRRFALATYAPTTGPAIQRQEATFGRSTAPPANLTYPVQATWQGGLVAPAFGRYRFRMDHAGTGNLIIDGAPVLTTTAATANVEGEFILARGVHDVELRGVLASPSTPVKLEWSVGGQAFAAVPGKVLWFGAGKALLGTIRNAGGTDPLALEQPPPEPGGADASVMMRRVDGFLGFRDAPSALSNGAQLLVAAWTGTISATQTGLYQFDVFSNGGSKIYIDGSLVVDNSQANGNPASGNGQVNLTAGPHQYDLRYSFSGGTGYLEAFWTPPNGERRMVGPEALHAEGGAWAPGTVNDPGNMSVQLQLGEDAKVMTPNRVISAGSELQQPRGMDVDKEGRIYVADTGHRRVAVLDANGKLVRAIGGEGKDPGKFDTPEDVAVGPNGKIYVLESTPPRVQIFSADGTFEKVFATDLCTSAGPTVGPDGLVYVANTCGGAVMQYTADGEMKARFTGGDGAATRLAQPVDVAVDSTGMIYVADAEKHRIVQLGPDGSPQKNWSVQIGGSLGASNMNLLQDVLYLTNPDRNTVAVLDPATGLTDLFGQGGDGPGQFRQPTGVAAGPDGLLYVLDGETGRIQVFPAAKLQQ